MCWSGGHRPDRCECEKESGELNHDLLLERSWDFSAEENGVCERSSGWDKRQGESGHVKYQESEGLVEMIA